MPELADSMLSSGPAELRDLLRQVPLPALDAGKTFSPLVDWLSENPDMGMPVAADEVAKKCCESGLWLLAGDLDRCHSICQDLKSAEAKYWHAIMHRREGDFWNAKYWFRQLQSHATYTRLLEESSAHHEKFSVNAKNLWDAQKFVDHCEQAIKKGTSRDRCQQLAWCELSFLLEHCWQLAWPT